MRRYWITAASLMEDQVHLDGDLFHHICVVCRQSVGDRFEVIHEQRAYFVELTEVKKKKAIAQVIESRELPSLKKPHIHLALSLPKFQTVDRVVEKMVELGVYQTHLFASDYSFMKPKGNELDKKKARWEKIILGATQQTGRGQVMGLTEVQPLRVLLERHFPDPKRAALLAYEGDGGVSVGNHLAQIQESVEEIWVFVGSEGGFSTEDMELFSHYNMLPISLGDQVLRVETACVTLVSILKYGLGHFD